MNMKEISKVVDLVRESNPLVHNITNVVVTNFTANGLLALGASCNGVCKRRSSRNG